jgi:hypothetical protein
MAINEGESASGRVAKGHDVCRYDNLCTYASGAGIAAACPAASTVLPSQKDGILYRSVRFRLLRAQ